MNDAEMAIPTNTKTETDDCDQRSRVSMSDWLACTALPKPYYEDESVALFCDDCTRVLPLIPANSVDLVLCDLPYGITGYEWDNQISVEWLWEMYRKQSGNIVLFAVQPFTTDLINAGRDLFRYDLVWLKKMVTGVGLANKRPMRAHENILVFYETLKIYNEQKREVSIPFGKIIPAVGNEFGKYDSVERGKGHANTILEYAKPNNLSIDGNLHPSQKPEDLCAELIAMYSNEESIVLDNTCGSGTTLVAAKRLGRKAIGIEISEKYCEIAVNRLRQQELFSGAS
jgi:site-specific DNA-methyltransferase (adenine-specific)